MSARRANGNRLSTHDRGAVLDRFGNRANSASPRGRTTRELVRQSNAWRDSYNPLRGLVVSRVVSLLEDYNQGTMAEVQWLWQQIERRYPVLRACIKRTASALKKRAWSYKIVADLPQGMEGLAKEQQAALRQVYEGIENMREAIRRLSHANFRGYCFLQKHRRPDGSIRELHWLPEWNWVRDGMFGAWFYNADARYAGATGFTADQQIGAGLPRDEFLIMESEAPVNEIATVAFANALMATKDWAAFVEIFGLPGAVVTMPQDVPQGQESNYESAASAVAEGGSGTIPYGATVSFPSGTVRGLAPFESFLKWHEKDVVLAATGGKLTMLTESGSGTLAGGAHKDAWDEIVDGDCQDVSELFQRDIDGPVLDAAFPGQPHLAYFEIDGISDEDANSRADMVVKLAGAGYRVSRDQVEEDLGVELEEASANPELPNPKSGNQLEDPGGGDAALQNRSAASRSASSLQDSARDAFLAAVAADLAPLRDRLQAILAIQDPEILRTRLAALRSELDQLKADIAADPEAARALAEVQSAAMINGLAGQSFVNRFNPNQARDDHGMWTRTAATAAKHGLSQAKFDGKTLKMADGSDAPDHLSKLGIPPAWTGVHVSRDPKSALQAVGLDAKGRVQRVYSQEFMATNAAKKFARNKELLAKQEKVFSQNRENLKSHDSTTRENAACMSLIMATGIRPGSSADTKAAKQAYGATTLEGRHVVIDGDGVRLKFTGKKGVALDIPVSDRAVAAMLRERKAAAGNTGKLFGTDAGRLRDYSHSLTGGSFKPKDFRTLVGTRTALDAIGSNPIRAGSLKEFKMRVREVAMRVSQRLGNTPAIALQSYINPFVFDAIKPMTP